MRWRNILFLILKTDFSKMNYEYFYKGVPVDTKMDYNDLLRLIVDMKSPGALKVDANYYEMMTELKRIMNANGKGLFVPTKDFLVQTIKNIFHETKFNMENPMAEDCRVLVDGELQRPFFQPPHVSPKKISKEDLDGMTRSELRDLQVMLEEVHKERKTRGILNKMSLTEAKKKTDGDIYADFKDRAVSILSSLIINIDDINGADFHKLEKIIGHLDTTILQNYY